jgi:uncharacterized protein YbjT (DUF2867 family)
MWDPRAVHTVTGMIFVTGATGNAGGAVVRALVGEGKPVRALVRADADAMRLPPGVDVAVGDLNRPETLRPHLRGVEAGFLLSGYDGIGDTLALMRDAGVARVVLLSSSAAPSGSLDNAVARYHVLSERAVRRSGLPWTFLQPNSFMSNTFDWIPQLRRGDTIRAPFATVPVATIDPDDVGAVAVVALTSSGHERREYRLSGPEALLPEDRVAVLARVLGRDLRLEPLSNEEARAELRRRMPLQYVHAFLSFFAWAGLDESEVLPTVEELTGRPPRSFEAWAEDHADAFPASDYMRAMSSIPS